MTASILSTTHNGDPAFGLKQRALARKPDLERTGFAVLQQPVACLPGGLPSWYRLGVRQEGFW
jgi:hypothetical protein